MRYHTAAGYEPDKKYRRTISGSILFFHCTYESEVIQNDQKRFSPLHFFLRKTEADQHQQTDKQRKKYVLVLPVKCFSHKAKVKRYLRYERKQKQPQCIFFHIPSITKALYQQKTENRKTPAHTTFFPK